MAENTNPKLAAEFVMRCFHARTAAHVLHLKSGSYSEHETLKEFYQQIIHKIDSFAEMYQGEYLTQLNCSGVSGYQTPTNSMALISGMIKWTKANREEICDSPECQALIDEIMELCNRTAYKLKFLK
jgi:hypothetical protein